MIANLNLPKRLQWYMVLAALTCVSASPSTMKPKTIFADCAAPKHSLGAVGQSDAQVERYLRRNSDTTESMDDENEDRGMDVPPIVQGLAAEVGKSVETVNPEVSAAIEQGIAAKVNEAGKSDVIPGSSGIDHVPLAKIGEAVEAGVDPTRLGKIYDVFTEAFKKIMGDEIEIYRNGGDLLKSDTFTMWSNFVDETYKNAAGADADVLANAPILAEEAKVNTLLSIFEKGAVVSMLEAGKKRSTTQGIANNLELGLLRKWELEGKEDNIMDLLIYGKHKSEVLMSTSLDIWVDHLKEKGRDPYELFVTHYIKRYSEKELVDMLVAGGADDRTRPLATELAKKIWKESEISVIRSFELLELNKEHLDTLLRNPLLSTWINFVKLLGPNPYEVLLLAMRKRVGDKMLDSILAAAKSDGTYVKIWQTLLHMQENYKSLKRLKKYPQAEGWQRDGKSGDDVFDLLEFPDKGKYMFETDDWNAWVAYMTYLEERKRPKDQREITTVIYEVLKNRFRSEDLPKLVATAKTVESTKEIAGKWERSEWRIAQRTPDDIFDFLELKKKGDAVFESPEFESWALYVKELNSDRNRKDDVELAYQLYRHYGPDVERMLKQSEKTAIEKNDKVTKTFVNKMRNEFEQIKPLEEKSPMKMELEETSPVEMEVEETSHEKKRLGKRLRTSSLAVATDSSKRTKMLDESEPPMKN
ncbi:unnamed protein product [Peronospora effusa]|nr:unnamed protein product [Peronospora effusa]